MAKRSGNEPSGMSEEKSIPTEMPMTDNPAPATPPDPMGGPPPEAIPVMPTKSGVRPNKKAAAKKATPKKAAKTAKTAKKAAKASTKKGAKAAKPAKPAKGAKKKKASPKAAKAIPAGKAQPKLDKNSLRQRKLKSKANQGRIEKAGIKGSIAGHISARGRRQQARRDTKNAGRG